MRIKLLISTIFLALTVAHGQTIFQKTYGGTGWEGSYPNSGGGYFCTENIQQTSDGGYIIIGSTYNSASSSNDIYLIKTNPNGDTLWTKIYADTLQESGQAVIETFDGGYLLGAERTNNYMSGNFADFYLIKTNSNGDITWTRAFNNPNFVGLNFDELRSIQQTNDSGYVVLGGLGHGTDFQLTKFDSNGTMLWAKYCYASPWGYVVRQTIDNGFIIGGVGNLSTTLIKLNAVGDTNWSKQYSIVNGEISLGSMEQTTDSGFIIAGLFVDYTFNNVGVFLMKTDSNGDTLWAKSYYNNLGFWGYLQTFGYSVKQTNDGGFIFGGTIVTDSAGTTDVLLIKTDSNGDTLWTRTYGGSNDDYCVSVKQTSDDGYILSGFTNSFGAGNYDLYLIKTDSLGNSGCNQSQPNIIVAPITPTASYVQALIVPTSMDTNNTSTILSQGGIINILCTITEIDDIHLPASRILVYPNPFSSSTTLQTDKFLKDATLTVYNSYGQKVKQIKNISGQTITLHRDNLPSGLYFLRLTQDNKTFSLDKLVITD